MPLISSYGVSLGCDPELFIKEGKNVVGSEKVVPEEGFPMSPVGSPNSSYGKIIRDGVQVEFNPDPQSCRQILATAIGVAIKTLHRKLPKGMQISFDTTVTVSKEELASLLPENRVLGCNASMNVYDVDATTGVKDGAKFLKRSGGGHIHLGFYPNYTRPGEEPTPNPMQDTLKNPAFIVPILDILVGNTMVLIDRDPGNAERRKTYGRAGEYRLPKYGLEYRTLSNFWLRNYVLMSLVFGLTRQAVRLAASHREGNDTISELISAVDINDVRKAINKNDAELAAKNFEKIAPIIGKLFPTAGYTLNKTNLKDFRHFVNRGMDHWFKEKPIDHWLAFKSGGSQDGWENFAYQKVRLDPKEVVAKPSPKKVAVTQAKLATV